MVFANGAEIHLVKGGNVFVSGCVIHAAAGGKLLLALHEFSVKESVIDIGEGGGGDTAGLEVPVKIQESVVSGIPVFVIADGAHGTKLRSVAADLRGGIGGIGSLPIAAEFFDAAEAVWEFCVFFHW